MAFNGFAKVLLHDGFGHLKLRLATMVSFFLVMVNPSLNMWVDRVYSVSASRISSLATGSQEETLISGLPFF